MKKKAKSGPTLSVSVSNVPKKKRDVIRADYSYLGENAVYPGHPVTVALCIALHYETYEGAFTKAVPHEFPEAVGDNAIPGAGGCVYTAMDLLKKLRDGKDFNEAMKWADDMWASIDHHPQKTDRWAEGQAQADKFKSKLAEQAAWWTKKELPQP